MTTLNFENLDFSFVIDVDRKIAYLQEWEDGNWSEPDLFELPQPPEMLQGNSRLARSLKSFRRDPAGKELREALTDGRFMPIEDDNLLVRFWAGLQASFRQLATAWAKEPG